MALQAKYLQASKKAIAMATDDWMDDYVDACDVAFGFMDLSTLQPTSWRHFQPLVANEWLDWFYSLKKTCDAKGVTPEKIARVFPPGLAHDHLFFTTEDLKAAHWPKEKRLEIAEWFYQVIRAGAHGDYFGLNGSNLAHGEKEVEQILEKDFCEGTPDAARALGRLHNATYNLGAALYLDFYMGRPIQNCGPYGIGNGEQLVVKQASGLQPFYIWPGIESCAEKIELFAVYEKSAGFSVDFITCHSQFKGDAISTLKKWRLEKDGKSVTEISEIDQITENIAQTGKKQWKTIKTLNEKELIEKALWIRSYIFKPICELVGMDWKPTSEMLEAIKGKTLEQGYAIWSQPVDEKSAKEYNRKIYDPRVDFYPSGAKK